MQSRLWQTAPGRLAFLKRSAMISEVCFCFKGSRKEFRMKPNENYDRHLKREKDKVEPRPSGGHKNGWLKKKSNRRAKPRQ